MIETELCKKKCTRKGVNTKEYSQREMCPNETENNHKVGSVGDNCCKGSQKVDLDMAWGIQLEGKMLEITKSVLSQVLCGMQPSLLTDTP